MRNLTSLALLGLLGASACEGGNTADLGPGIPSQPAGDGGVVIEFDAGERDAAGATAINVISPKKNGAYKDGVPIDIEVASDVIDPGAMPEVRLGDRVLPLAAGAAAGKFSGSIVFDSFEPPLAGDQLLRVTAKRGGVVTEADVVFTVDQLGPSIVEASPRAGSVVGGIIRVEARIADPAGVTPGSPVAFIGNESGQGFALALTSTASDPTLYGAIFDTRVLTTCGLLPDDKLCVVWPNVSFRAKDKLGNETTVAYDVGIDNQPPLLDFDSAPVRVLRHDPILGDICSHEFEPLGGYTRLGDLPKDGCGVGQLFDLRIRIEDQGNGGTGIKVPPISLVEPKSVVAYVLDDTSQPLAVDSDNDGICDDINPTLLPTVGAPLPPKPLLAVRLPPVPPAGGADFTPDPTLMSPICSSGAAPASPPPLCASTRIPQVIGYPHANSPEPAIYGLDPIRGEWCTGAQFDVHANDIQDGWACVAVVAEDRAGNRNVSQVLRVYVDRTANSLVARPGTCPAPPPSAGPPPACTGRLDRATGALSAGACTSRRFLPQIIDEAVVSK